MKCPWPECGAELDGLGRFCHTCNRYTDQPIGGQPAVQEGASRASNEQATGHVGAGGRQVVVLPLPPSANAIWRSVAGARKGLVGAVLAFSKGQGTWRQILGQLYVNVTTSSAGKQFKKDAALWLLAQRTTKIQGDVRLSITFYMSRRGMIDLDNRIKPTLDCLAGAFYDDDKQVVEVHAVKRYDKHRPRAVVVAEPDDGSTVLDPGAEFNFELAF